MYTPSEKLCTLVLLLAVNFISYGIWWTIGQSPVWTVELLRAFVTFAIFTFIIFPLLVVIVITRPIEKEKHQ